jgi:tRNA (guanosine-2'-O-)-methyltransferase
MNQIIIERLKEFASPERVELFERILQKRTNYFTVAIEDIYQEHNASAVLRSCDCFGIQTVHTIEKQNEFKPNKEVAMGASKWLTINQHRGENALQDTYANLKKAGYRVVATTPHTNDVTLNEFDISKGPAAFVFGTEMRGLTKEAIEMADEHLRIPMYGFTESFNISVSVAIILHHVRETLNESDINWKLTTQEHEDILLTWLKTSIKKSDLIIEKLMQKLADEEKNN